ncbi:MAG: alanine racemase, partial [Desulfovibrio sp.]|nr:alanine racemase [Desulfovibrio sp.]
MPCTFTPAFCRIDLAALRRNFRRLGAPEGLMPVIKSDAYGHGLLPVATALSEAGARRFAVGTASEGIALRRAGFGQEIVPLMGCLTPEEWRGAAAAGLTPLLASFDDIEAAAGAARATGVSSLPVALKCDTGMGRLGFTPDEAPELAERLRAHRALAPRFALSHLSSVDMPGEDAYTAMQVRRFERFFGALAAAFPGILPSLGNSAGTLGPARAVSGICRPGLALYGGHPFAGPRRAAHRGGREWAQRR